jgi:hypothetical protein
MGATIGFIDLTPPSTCVITGLVAGFNGQMVTITNLSANSLTLNALDGSSAAANQFRMVGNTGLGLNNGATYRYSTTIAKWIQI